MFCHIFAHLLPNYDIGRCCQSSEGHHVVIISDYLLHSMQWTNIAQ